MAYLRRSKTAPLLCCIACFLALSWVLLFPSIASAHAILLRSNPTKNAVLRSTPARIQMWFSEDLNPTFTTSYVVAANTPTSRMANKSTHVDQGDAHIVAGSTKEMDVSLKPNLAPGIYLVFYRTQSAADGHFLNASFLFSIASPNGTVPASSTSPAATDNTAPTTSVNVFTGPMLFNLLMVTLVELGIVFWVGAQLWHIFVFALAETTDPQQLSFYRQVQQRFEHLFSVPTLLVLFIANIGVLIAQGLVLTNGQWGQALAPSLLYNLINNGHFGIYWIAREGLTILALLLGATLVLLKPLPRMVSVIASWANLVIGLALLVAVALSGHAAAVNSVIVPSSVLVDWLHLLAASLWVGGMFYIATTYLPLVKEKVLKERVASLLTTLSYYSPLAIIGVVIMSVTGTTEGAIIHNLTWHLLVTSAYGLTLIVKIFLIAGLLFMSAVHVFFLRPRLKKAYQKYSKMREMPLLVEEAISSPVQSVTTSEVKAFEGRMQRQSTRLMQILRWEALLGITVLLCTGLLTVFGGTLQPATTQAAGTTQQHAPPKPFAATVTTTDGLYTIALSVTPNQQGANVFTVHVHNKQGKLETTLGVSIYTSLLDMMDMGTDTVNLHSDGKGNFSANGDLNMSGLWRLSVEVRTPDNTVHNAQFQLSNR